MEECHGLHYSFAVFILMYKTKINKIKYICKFQVIWSISLVVKSAKKRPKKICKMLFFWRIDTASKIVLSFSLLHMERIIITEGEFEIIWMISWGVIGSELPRNGQTGGIRCTDSFLNTNIVETSKYNKKLQSLGFLNLQTKNLGINKKRF